MSGSGQAEVAVARVAVEALVGEAEAAAEPEAEQQAGLAARQVAAGKVAPVAGQAARAAVVRAVEEPVAVRVAVRAVVPAVEIAVVEAVVAEMPAAPIFRASPTGTIHTTNRARLFRHFRRVLPRISRFFTCSPKAPAVSSSSTPTIC